MKILRAALEGGGVGKELLLLGEKHGEKHQMSNVVSRIKEFNPDALVHELAYDDIALTTEELSDRIANAKVGGVCDPNLNIDVYKLALQLKIPLIGCDLSQKKFDDLKGKSLAEVFTKREAHMVTVITTTSKNYGRVAAVVGDTHLRSTAVEDLGGESALVDDFNEFLLGFSKGEMVRIPKSQQEVK